MDIETKLSRVTLGRLAVLFAAILIVISRRPDAFTNPQFWAEDGAQWYADAYNCGWWKVLLAPSAGYIQVLPRLCATLALVFPLIYAPALCNAAAVGMQVLPAVFILSQRFRSLADFNVRVYLSFLYLALPNSSELNANITCAQWRLSLLAFLVLIAEPPPNLTWRCFDLTAIILCGLSGPFPIFLAPLALFLWSRRRHAWTLTLALTLLVGAVIQAATIAEFHTAGRSHEILGATTGRLLKILSGKIFLAAVVGAHDLGSIQAGWNLYLLIAACIVAFSATILVYAASRGPLELKLFIAFGVMLLVAALIFPMASMNTPQWYVLHLSTSGLRYWFIPMLVFVATLVWSAAHNNPSALRITARVILALMVIGVVRDWRYPALVDLNFPQYASSFEQSAPGTNFRIPLNPPGWSMHLVKVSGSDRPRNRSKCP